MTNKITNVDVWGIRESVIASNYPMSCGDTIDHRQMGSIEYGFDRAERLGNTPTGSGHDCFLKGIVVQFDWKISQVMFPQVERYHFIDIISSQSKMHRLTLCSKDSFNEHVDPVILDRFMKMVEVHNDLDPEDNRKKEQFDKVVYSCPMGYELTARFTTNYLQLKTIYKQRRNHKLQEWKDFCVWVEDLPYFREFCLKK